MSYPTHWGEERIKQLEERDRVLRAEAQDEINRAKRFGRIDHGREFLTYHFVVYEDSEEE